MQLTRIRHYYTQDRRI